MSEGPDDLMNLFLLDRAAMTPDQIHALCDWIKSDPAHARRFVRTTLLHRHIHDHFAASDPARKSIFEDDSLLYDPQITGQDLYELLFMEQHAPSTPAPKTTEPEVEVVHRPATVKRANNRFWLWVFLTSMAVLALLLIPVFVLPFRPRIVATLTDTLDAQWADTSAPMESGAELLNDGRPLRLLNGLAEIEFNDGVLLVLEGPAEFSVADANWLSLAYGRICAYVPPAATGFQIDTVGCRVIDMGTEFGLHAQTNGLTSVQMYTGLAALEPLSPTDRPSGPSVRQTLVAGQARAVDTTGTIQQIKIKDDFFVRQFSSETGMVWRGQRINLADIVGGGNGLGTGQLTCGIDCRTGEFVTDRPTGEVSTAPDYQTVPTNPYIDGAFLAYPDSGPVRISTEQHVFAECPPYNGLGRYCIFNGFRKLETPRHLQGLDYQAGWRPYIDMHSTQGITFDLRAVRSLVRGMDKRLTIKHFSAHAGIAREAIDVIRQQGETGLSHADLWVLVDGQVRAHQAGLNPAESAVPIDVKLLADDTFLTLVVTDGGDDGRWDWVLIVDPMLDIGY